MAVVELLLFLDIMKYELVFVFVKIIIFTLYFSHWLFMIYRKSIVFVIIHFEAFMSFLMLL
jgi:hypothetical protein